VSLHHQTIIGDRRHGRKDHTYLDSSREDIAEGADVGRSVRPRRRELVAERWDYRDRQQTVGGPRVRQEIIELVTRSLLLVMEGATGRVHFAGSTIGPDQRWMKQVARILTESGGGFLCGTRHLLTDRDAKCGNAFRSTLGDAGGTSVRLPPLSPDLNAPAAVTRSERSSGAIRQESEGGVPEPHGLPRGELRSDGPSLRFSLTTTARETTRDSAIA
jgi:hypothetical protein